MAFGIAGQTAAIASAHEAARIERDRDREWSDEDRVQLTTSGEDYIRNAFDA